MAQDRPSNDHSFPVFLVIALFGGGVLFIAWYINHRWMTSAWMWFEWALLQPIRYTVGLATDFPVRLSHDLLRLSHEKMQCRHLVRGDANAYSFGTLIQCQDWKSNMKMGWWVATEVGKYWRWVMMVFVGYTLYKIWTRPVKRFLGPLTVSQFLQNQGKHWKAIVPFLHKDFVGDEGPEYAASLSPVELSKREGVVIERYFQEKIAKKVLLRQLGKVYKKENFSDCEKALFVCFSLRIKRKPKEAKALFDGINESMRGGKKPNLEPAIARFEELFADEEVQKRVEGHNFISTALFEMIIRACDYDGVLPPAEFLPWVKPAQRELWYALNRAPAEDGISFPTETDENNVPDAKLHLEIASFAEGLQIVCQWQAEKVCKQNDLYMTDVFFDRALVGWKSALYDAGEIDEEVKNVNAIEMAKIKRLKQVAKMREASRVKEVP